MDFFREYYNELVKNDEIFVVGAGGWGTALATVLAENGYKVKIWARENELVENINSKGENNYFLPNVNLHKNIYATNNLHEIENQNIFVSAVPTQFIRRTFSDLKIDFSKKKVLNVAKGIEVGTLDLCSKIFADLGVQSENFGVLSGPSHAEEVALFSPTTVVTSSEDIDFARFIQELFSNEYFRVYTSGDLVGCELGGSIKNVIAIAAGIIDGLKFGDNTKAALITRGLAEMTRLSVSLGANQMTLSGLSGLGDLIVTCNSLHSRNRKVGDMLGNGMRLDDILEKMQMVAEGIETTKSTYLLSQKQNVEMPIVEKVYEILFENLNSKEAIRQLMTRSSKHEWWW